MAQLDLSLPEITIPDFQHSWTRFELVSSAKKWNEAKQKLILPTLLSKLVYSYVALDEMACSSLGNIKKALMESMGIARDPLTAGQAFMCCHQGAGKAVRDYVMDLKKLFKKSYPDESPNSPILLQRLLTGLHHQYAASFCLKGNQPPWIKP